MKRGENFNHPPKGAIIRVAPIKCSRDIEAIKNLLSNEPRNLAIFTIGINTSLRPGELLNIRVGEVNSLEPMDRLDIKETRTKKRKGIILNHACIESIRFLLRSLNEKDGQYPASDDLLFTGVRGPLSVSTLNNLVKKWCAQIGMKGNYGGHSLRKTYAYHQLFRYGRSIQDLMAQLNQRKKSQTFIYLCIGPEERSFLEQKNGSGSPGFSVGLLKKQNAGTETEIREREEGTYRVLFENANDGIVLMDTKGKVVEVNEANGKIFGWTRDEVMGKNVFNLGLFAPEDEKAYFEQMTKSFADGDSSGIWEAEAIRKDGTPVFVEVNVNVVRKDGIPTGLLSVIRDVTDRKHMEQALQESEEMKKALLDATTDAVMLLDLQGTVLDINTAYAEKFATKPEKIIGACLWDLIPSSLLRMRKEIEQVIQTGKSIRFETKYHEEWLDNIVYPVSEMQGNVIRIAVFSHDITARKLTEETLRKHRDHLEKMVKDRTINLEQTNTALKVLLKRRDEDKIELEDKMLFNVKELVLPFLDELKNSRMKKEQEALIEVIEYNLNDIMSPFARTVSSKFYNLTPTEIRIANLIKQGKSSKEIADQLKLSSRTIDIHRYHIRKKFGLNTKKANLRTHLLSIN